MNMESVGFALCMVAVEHRQWFNLMSDLFLLQVLVWADRLEKHFTLKKSR